MPNRPGTPGLLRELNDRAALDLLLSTGPLTRTQVGEATGLSKVTAAQLLGRLEERGLVEVVGESAGGRGPNAALYAVVPSCAYVAGLHVVLGRIAAAVADITGTVVGESRVDLNGVDDPVALVHGAVVKAGSEAGVALSRLQSFVIGTPGVVDPGTGDVRYAFDLPEWHAGVLAALRHDLRRPVTIENDVNLAAAAERAAAAGRDADDFALMWVGQGLGLAVVLGGRLNRGLAGGAGEIGWLPVPGAPLPPAASHPERGGPRSLQGGFQSLAGPEAVRALAREYGFARDPATETGVGRPSGPAAASVAESVGAAVAAGPAGAPFLDALAERLAVGVASVCVVLDPGLIVLSGEVGRAGGAALAERVQRALARICPTTSRVAVTSVEGNPVLRGALLVAVEAAREEVFSAPR